MDRSSWTFPFVVLTLAVGLAQVRAEEGEEVCLTYTGCPASLKCKPWYTCAPRPCKGVFRPGCVPDMDYEGLCQLPEEPGNCYAYIPRYYYNSAKGECLPFVYGGCGGNGNRFVSKEACEQRCLEGLCQLPEESGNCYAYIPRYYYDAAKGECLSFVYGGCGGNANRFVSKEACEKRCVGSEIA